MYPFQSPNYYNTFINPSQPQQYIPSSGGGQTVSGSLQGSGPSNNFQPGWSAPYNQNQQGGQLPMFTPGMSDDQVRGLVNQWAQRAGTTNADNGDYFTNFYHQVGNSDPNYFMTRLANGIVQDAHGNPNAFQGTGVSYGAGTAGGPGSSDSSNQSQQNMSSGSQNDPMAWRRQNYMRQNQRPQYGGGYGYNPYQQMYGGGMYSPGGYGGYQAFGNTPGYSYLQGTSPSAGYNYGSYLNQPNSNYGNWNAWGNPNAPQ
jgi:hypothetical protein